MIEPDAFSIDMEPKNDTNAELPNIVKTSHASRKTYLRMLILISALLGVIDLGILLAVCLPVVLAVFVSMAGGPGLVAFILAAVAVGLSVGRPLALVAALGTVMLLSAVFGMELMGFLEIMLKRTTMRPGNVALYLMIPAAIAGAALGVFLAATALPFLTIGLSGPVGFVVAAAYCHLPLIVACRLLSPRRMAGSGKKAHIRIIMTRSRTLISLSLYYFLACGMTAITF